MEVKIYRELENETLIFNEQDLAKYNALASELGLATKEDVEQENFDDGNEDGNIRHGVFLGDKYNRRLYIGYVSANGQAVFEGDLVDIFLTQESLGGNGGSTDVEKEISGIVGIDEFGTFIQTPPQEPFKDESEKIYFLELIGLNEESITVTGNVYQNDKYNPK